MDQESYSEGDVVQDPADQHPWQEPRDGVLPQLLSGSGSDPPAQAESIGLTVPFLGGGRLDGLEGYATADQLKDLIAPRYAKGSSTAFEDAC